MQQVILKRDPETGNYRHNPTAGDIRNTKKVFVSNLYLIFVHGYR
jgi:hypothetical protein